jgi:hypothetical protein
MKLDLNKRKNKENEKLYVHFRVLVTAIKSTKTLQSKHVACIRKQATPQNTILENRRAAQLVTKFSAFYGTGSFVGIYNKPSLVRILREVNPL